MNTLQLIQENVNLAIYKLINTQELNARLNEVRVAPTGVYSTEAENQANINALTFLFHNGELTVSTAALELEANSQIKTF